MNALLQKLKAATTIKETDILADSIIYAEKDMIPTHLPALNLALSGKIDGGLSPGFTMVAGPSKHFKSLFMLLICKAYMDYYPEAVMLFFDTEFGTGDYFQTLGFDMNRVLAIPIMDVEEFKQEAATQLNNIKRGDKVIIAIDSVGNMASRKETEDALDGKTVADMTRAKQLKSAFRIITPHLRMKDIPMIGVNHTYKTLEMFSKDVVGGGTGAYYSADDVFIVGRRQIKEGTEVTGWDFILNVDKSRYVQEKAKIPLTVKYDGGINRWSGLFDIALATGDIQPGKKGWYHTVDDDGVVSEKAFRKSELDKSDSYMQGLLTKQSFIQKVEGAYRLGSGSPLLQDVTSNTE